MHKDAVRGFLRELWEDTKETYRYGLATFIGFGLAFSTIFGALMLAAALIRKML